MCRGPREIGCSGFAIWLPWEWQLLRHPVSPCDKSANLGVKKKSFLSDIVTKCQTYSLRVLYWLKTFIRFSLRTFDEWLSFFPSCLVFRTGINFVFGNFASWRYQQVCNGYRFLLFLISEYSMCICRIVLSLLFCNVLVLHRRDNVIMWRINACLSDMRLCLQKFLVTV